MKKNKQNLLQAILEEPKGIFRSLYQYPLYFEKLLRNKKIKNCYKNEVLYILGNSPNLINYDIGSLEDKNILVMNRFYKYKDSRKLLQGKGLKFYLTPPCHPPYDVNYWKKYLNQIINVSQSNTKLLIGMSTQNYSFEKFDLLKNHKCIENIFYFLPVGPRFIEFCKLKRLFLKPYLPIISSGTASVYALLFACYMGFKKIYLLGIDHSHIFDRKIGKNDNFFEDESKKSENHLPNYIQLYLESNTFFQYQFISNSFPYSKIYNCSKDSYLDCFAYKDFQLKI